MFGRYYRMESFGALSPHPPPKHMETWKSNVKWLNKQSSMKTDKLPIKSKGSKLHQQTPVVYAKQPQEAFSSC